MEAFDIAVRLIYRPAGGEARGPVEEARFLRVIHIYYIGARRRRRRRRRGLETALRGRIPFHKIARTNYISCPVLQDRAHVGRELGEAAQVGVQAAVLARQEGRPHVLHLQPGREAGGCRMPGRHHPDLGQKPQRESSNKHTHTHTHARLADTQLQKAVNTGCLFYCNTGSSVRRAERSTVHGAALSRVLKRLASALTRLRTLFEPSPAPSPSDTQTLGCKAVGLGSKPTALQGFLGASC